MKWFILIITILLFIFILIFITKLNIYITYSHIQKDDHFHLKLRAWGGIIRYSIKIPVIKVAEDSASLVYKKENGINANNAGKDDVKDFTVEEMLISFENMKNLIKHVFGFHILVRKFLNKVKVKTFQWHSLIGTGDAVLTGISVGGSYAIKGSIIGLLSRYIRFKEMPIYSITPDYQKASASTSFFCIVEFRIGHAIVAGIKIFRYWKGGKVKISSEQVAKDSS
ncbi:DUF2953 domain-containing protein [Peribacillus loiseleuriae]|uniref:DUF2953 domain-containing protein n=1 Tax=Peribacillus loiseleuriae TaxID=1679170 RepID=A0A0K9GXB9_9BACI|nr:DUF2953 domain-containing protein [Peribacillus loiseleuriae]KMY51256.1 hypothetical protein AC625_18310 [Peribacillus loiseleuriae]